MPYEEIQCYYSVRCFCMLPPSFNPLALNYLDYVQRKRRIVGEQPSEMRPELKCVPEGEGEGEGKVVSQEMSSLFILSTLSYATLPWGLGFGPALEYRYEPDWKQTGIKDAGPMMRWGRLMTSQVWCPAWQLKAQIWWSHVWGWTDGARKHGKWVKCLFLYSSFFISTNQSVAAWTELVRQKATSPDRCLTSVVSRKSQWLDVSTIITYLKIQNFRQCILMQCNKVVCLWAEWECMWTYFSEGGTDGKRKWGGSG